MEISSNISAFWGKRAFVCLRFLNLGGVYIQQSVAALLTVTRQGPHRLRNWSATKNKRSRVQFPACSSNALRVQKATNVSAQKRYRMKTIFYFKSLRRDSISRPIVPVSSVAGGDCYVDRHSSNENLSVLEFWQPMMQSVSLTVRTILLSRLRKLSYYFCEKKQLTVLHRP
jgi:hypothetical protein